MKRWVSHEYTFLWICTNKKHDKDEAKYRLEIELTFTATPPSKGITIEAFR
jgi:hypothetical protein